jgi:hypothetical protein
VEEITTQHHLRDGLVVVRGHPAQHRVGEQVVLALREGSPGLMLYAVGSHHLVIDPALMERVGLDLIDSGGDVVVLDEVDQPVRKEVRDADRLRAAPPIDLLHGSPLAVVVTEGLVDQVEIHVVEA